MQLATEVSDVLSDLGLLSQDVQRPSDLGSDALLQVAADIAALRLPDSSRSAVPQHPESKIMSSSDDAHVADLAAAASTAADLAFLGFDPSDAALLGSSYPPLASEDVGGYETADTADEEDRRSSSGVPWHELLLSEPLNAADGHSAAFPPAESSEQRQDSWRSASCSSPGSTWGGGRPSSSRLGEGARRVPQGTATRRRAATARADDRPAQQQQQRGWDDSTVVQPPSRHAQQQRGGVAKFGAAGGAVARLHAQASCTLADAWPFHGGCRAAAPAGRSRPQTAVPRRRALHTQGGSLLITSTRCVVTCDIFFPFWSPNIYSHANNN
jgi:hypothetical protein